MSINWYPGHMVKARREIEESIKLVDIVVILLDARAPFSCRNPELEKIARKKKIVFILNKMDLASQVATREYIRQFRQEGKVAVAMDSISGKGSREVLLSIRDAFREEAEALLKKGRRIRPARIMVVGVPNIGKSTFLNCLVGKKMSKTGAKPGVTRGKQWVRVREDVELMDTPGLMWPKIEEEEQGLKMALLNIVGENAYDEYEVALYLLKVLIKQSPEILIEKYKLQDIEKSDNEILEDISRKRGHLLKGGELDLEKTCKMLLQEYRKGKLDRISLD